MWLGLTSLSAVAQETAPALLRPGDRLTWKEAANNLEQVRSYVFVAYVDEADRRLLDSQCVSSDEPLLFDCVSEFPALAEGRHRITIAAVGNRNTADSESDQSEPLYVEASQSISAPSPIFNRPPVFEDDPSQSDPQRIQLHDPVDVTHVGEGLVIVAERLGRILAVHFDETGQVQLREWAHASANRRLLALEAVDGRSLFALYEEASVGALVRYTITPYGLRDPVTIVDRLPLRENAPAVLRRGPDKTLYVALPATNGSDDRDAGSWVGKVLRFNLDGTLPNGSRSVVLGLSAFEPYELVWRGAESWLLGANASGVASIAPVIESGPADERRVIQLPAVGARTIRASGDGTFNVAGESSLTLRVGADGVLETRLNPGGLGRIISVIEDGNVLITCTVEQLIIQRKPGR